MTDTHKLYAAADRLDELIKAMEEHATEKWHAEACADIDDDSGEHVCIVGSGTVDHGTGMSTSRVYIADCESPAIAAYVAAMDPLTGRALSRLLRDCAENHEPNMCLKHEGCGQHPLGCQWCADEDFPCQDYRNALAIADSILDTQKIKENA